MLEKKIEIVRMCIALQTTVLINNFEEKTLIWFFVTQMQLKIKNE